ncbi:KH DOMAIN CONTAINING RNA BINDING PROTEIN [Salix viminalis]|uniref:KH DOMAIN CONTAINING RNA BINDING PROTEIN n=1 Tax=Salix viminalis TaxID=40686 RepID=A0A9Q0QJD6_SALVM|nr:KH DOMAIN CONTAINING RNA BINDING PROTEIN [Salix viminalis]
MPWIREFGDHPPDFGPGGFIGAPPGHGRELSAEFSMKLLCSTGKIGKGSSNFKVVEQEAGASIHVEDASAKSEEHAIRVFTFEGIWNPRSHTIETILQLQNKITSEFSDKRLAGILGQGGQDINEMRRLEADIRVYPKNEKSKCASEDDELVQTIRVYPKNEKPKCASEDDELVQMFWILHQDLEQELCTMKMLEWNLSVLDLSWAFRWHTTYQE